MEKETAKCITELVKFLDKQDTAMSYQQLISYLKFNGIHEYSNPRGIGSGISSLWKTLKAEKNNKVADALACRIRKNNNKYGWDKSNVKQDLYAKQKGVCTGCKEFFVEGNLSKDHIKPKAHGGTDDIDNLQLLCRSCNSIKGKREMSYLLDKLKGK